MPIQVVHVREGVAEGITMKEIQELVDRNFEKTRKKDGFLGFSTAMEKEEDSRSCWFSALELLALFEANGLKLSHSSTDIENWGLRIYYGYHHNDNSFPPQERRQEGSHNQHTAILVATHTRDGIDNLDCLDPSLNNQVTIAGVQTGEGEDNGTICPPPRQCKGLLIQ